MSGGENPVLTPVVNRVAPNQRAGRWASIQSLVAPFGNPVKRSFGFWFNYLWEEARQSPDLTDGDRARLCDAFFTVLQLNGAKPNPVPGLDAMAFEKKRAVLTTLLVMGFKRVPLSGVINSGGVGRRVDRAASGASIFMKSMEYAVEGGKQTVRLGFRADSRNYETLVRQGGFKARARSDQDPIYTKFGFDQPWNPLALDVYANSLFLRKGINRDNCLHTVISVSKELKEIFPYPLLSDESLFPLANKPLKTWTPQDDAAALSHWLKVRAVRANDVVDHLETEICVYVVRVDNAMAFNTEKWQNDTGGANPFPEAAVKEINVNAILAEMKIKRKHFWDQPPSGGGSLTFYDFDVISTRVLPSEEDQIAAYGPDFPDQLKAKLQSLEREAKNGWAQALQRYRNKDVVFRAGPTGGGLSKCPHCNKEFPRAQFIAHKNSCPDNPANR
jgi:hypothetical protein